VSSERNWQGIRDFISTRENFIITTHVNPDGDAIGSEIAMSLYLQKCGKNVAILNSSPTPRFYRFLDPDNVIRIFDSDEDAIKFKWAHGCIVLDVSDWKRLRQVGKGLQKSDLPTVCIDHHVLSDNIGEIQVVDEAASSTGEMLFDFFVDSEVTIDQDIANALYTCVLTDTGSFRFSNTTPHAHHVASALLERGADFRTIYRKVYESYSIGRMRLIGKVWSEMQFNFCNKLAWFVITQDMLREAGINQSEIEGFSELPRIVENVEVNLLFTELDNGKIKVSLRSKGNISIHEVALKLNGGGHKFAAGAVIDGPLQVAKDRVLAEIRPIFEKVR